eukprot:6465014-Amphidinium_carterae.1
MSLAEFAKLCSCRRWVSREFTRQIIGYDSGTSTLDCVPPCPWHVCLLKDGEATSQEEVDLSMCHIADVGATKLSAGLQDSNVLR